MEFWCLEVRAVAHRVSMQVLFQAGFINPIFPSQQLFIPKSFIQIVSSRNSFTRNIFIQNVSGSVATENYRGRRAKHLGQLCVPEKCGSNPQLGLRFQVLCSGCFQVWGVGGWGFRVFWIKLFG